MRKAIYKIKNLPVNTVFPYRHIALYCLASAMCIGCAQPAYAQFNVMCRILNANMGFEGLIPAIASIGIIMLGVGALFGKISWGVAVTVAVGIGVMFGYSAIVTSVSTSVGLINIGCPAFLVGP